MAAVDRESQRLLTLAAADVHRRRRHHHAGRECGPRAEGLVRRDRVEDGFRDQIAHRRVLRVDHRTVARHGDRFLEFADLQLHIDRSGKVRGKLDALALHGSKTRQRKRDAVPSRRQVHQLVLAVRIGDDGPHFFNQCGAGGFHGDTGQHGAGGVFHDPGNAARAQLGARSCGHQQHAHHRTCDSRLTHGFLQHTTE